MNETIRQNLTLEELIEVTGEHLTELNYSQQTLKKINRCWSRFKKFAKTENVTRFTLEFGLRFLKEHCDIETFKKAPDTYRGDLRRAITMLSDYQCNGFIRKRKPMRLHDWPSGYHDICEAFMDDVVRGKLSIRTQRLYQSDLEKSINFFVKSGALSVDDLSAKMLDEYFASYIGYSKRTISNACYVARTFLNYAFTNGYIKNDLTVFIPKVKVNRHSNLPSVLTVDEIQKLLASVDRGNPQGKRDYAMLLLAVRYGMRVGDIVALRLSNLDFEGKKIKYIQSKTNTPVSFDMLESVGWALLDYLKNARPQTDSPNVFVRLIAPYDGFECHNNLNHVMKKYLARAGIKQTAEKHYGFHMLRHSLASHLLEQGNPIHVISDALEHLNIDSTMIYTKINLSMLSHCTLEVPNASD